MRVCVLSAITYLIVAAALATVTKQELEIGKILNLMVLTVNNTVDGCFVKTPQNQIIEFKPNDNSDKNKYKLLPGNLLTFCEVEVTITDSKDNGHWEIYFTENETIIRTSEYDITVKSSGEETETEEEAHTHNATWLTPIEYIVTTGMTVEISVRKIEDVYACSLSSPNHSIIQENEEHDGINFFKTNSDIYTSCRVQIGPITVNDEALLGEWYLCSQRLVDNELAQECQKAYISWNNGNPNSFWSKETQSKFKHPVHFESSLSLTVQSSSNIKTCHVITPSGNDLALSEDSKFPYVTRKAPFTDCNVAIGPIDYQCLGDWTLYGIFTGFEGVREVRLPTSFFLYNEQNPNDQAYNVTIPEPIVKITNTINTVDLEVTGKGKVDSCNITPPEKADIETDVIFIDNTEACRYSVGPITVNMLGEWLVTAKFTNNDLHTEIQQIFTIKQEDPYNPELDWNRVVRYLDPIRFDTSLGKIHEVVISGDQNFRIVESCHVRIPDGRQYSVIEGFHITGVEAEKGTDCSLKITVASKDMIGEWTLIARKSDFGLPVEERLNFTINVEVPVEAVPSQVTIYESQDLSVRLRDKIDFFESCKLYGPEGEYMDFEIDPENYDHCAFIVRNVDETMNGTWQIVYEDGIVYRASIAVKIVREGSIDFPDLTWVIDDKADIYIGPEDASFCQIMDPIGDIVFEGFGRCKITLSRVELMHDGIWTTKIGHQGKIIMETYSFKVKVEEPTEYRPTVFSQVETRTNPPSISLSCFVATSHDVQLCKFRDPQGSVLIASDGVAQGRYMATGNGKFNNSGVYEHDCGLRISNATASDFGIWRCAIDTSNDTYYGFLTVQGGSAVPAPKLIANKNTVKTVVSDEVTMSCNIQTNIQYCYFRKEDGTVYNLVPGISSDVEYYGAGFDAGECGIKFKTQNVKDSGQWTCNVGIKGLFTEKKAAINLVVYDELTLKQYLSGKALVVSATAMQHHNNDIPRVDYCRYVRADGFSFTSESLPFSYMTSNISGNTCVLLISRLTIVDYYPWTVVMKMRGRMKELTGVTTMNITYYYYYWNSVALWLWLSITLIGLSLIVLGFSLGPKKNREWALSRARTIKNSIRSSIRSRTSFHTSFRKAPLPLPSIINEKPPAYSTE